MKFLIKKDKIKLNFYTSESQHFANVLYPRFSKEIYPNWWKNIERTEDKTTMKSCPGFVEFFRHSISIPLWKDIDITYSNKIEKIEIAGVNDSSLHHWIDIHPKEQYGDGFTNGIHLKLKNPWLATVNDSTKFMLTDATWHRNRHDMFTVVPGMLEFKYQSSAHINMFLHKSPITQKIKLLAGTPIAYIVPLTDKQIDLTYSRVNYDTWSSLFNPIIKFRGSYNALKKLSKE